jgi:histidine triad (HIT) family protein
MTNCIFCKISKNEIPSTKVIENDHYFVIKDIQPQAKKHFLVIPKLHVDSIHQTTDYQGLHETIRSLVIQQNLAEVGLIPDKIISSSQYSSTGLCEPVVWRSLMKHNSRSGQRICKELKVFL